MTEPISLERVRTCAKLGARIANQLNILFDQEGYTNLEALCTLPFVVSTLLEHIAEGNAAIHKEGCESFIQMCNKCFLADREEMKAGHG